MQQGFGFEDPDDDVFSNMGLRSRLNRMGHPFDWPRRRAGQPSQSANDPYEKYFDEVDFPHFGSTWDAFNRMGNNKRATDPQDRSGFFDYLPQEFRQYMPENFGFGGMRHARSPPQQPAGHQYGQTPAPESNTQAQQHPQVPPQAATRSNLCDAAIQTEDLSGGPPSKEQVGANLNQHGLRNTTDLGQRSAQEDVRNDRAQSAPPPQHNGGNVNQASAFASNNTTPAGTQTFTQTSTNGPNAFANATTNPQANFFPGQQFNYPPQQGHQFYGQPQAFGQQATQFPPQYYPPPHGQFQNKPPQPQAQPPPQPQPAAGDNFVRNVPIFVEGRNEPVVGKNASTQQSAPTAAPQQSAPPAPPQRQQQQPRPEPFTSKEAFQPQQQAATGPDNADEETIPQTPHTADCISKIQAIQRDVLELMCAVEQFGGKRGDKEYAYLDEMLTRNLLKLDTIDTNGKENIRLARKEAIKCIQASIAVLEAKADLDLNAKKDETPASESTTTSATAPEKMDVDVPANSESNEPAGGDNATNVADKEATSAAVDNAEGASALSADQPSNNSQSTKSSSGEQVDKKDNNA